MAKKARYTKITLPLQSSNISLYAGSRIADAARHLAQDLNTYDGIKYVQILEAVYNQGKKDGAADAFEVVTKNMKRAQDAVPHKNPGRPKKAS